MGLGRHMATGLSWFERHALVYLVVLGYAAALPASRGPRPGWPWLVAMAAVALLLLHRLYLVYRVRRSLVSDQRRIGRAFWQLELLVICGASALIQATGGLSGPLAPLLWLLLAAIGGLAADRRHVAIGLLLAIGLVLLPASAPVLAGRIGWEALWRSQGWQLLAAVLALAAFAYLGRLLVAGLALHLRLKAGRDARERQVQAMLERVQQERDAQQYRLHAGVAELRGGERSAAKRQRSSLSKLRQRVRSLLVILNEALRPHTVAFFLLDKEGRSLKLMDHLGGGGDGALVDEPLPAGRGVLGAILKNRHTVSFNHARWDADRFAYYQHRVELKTFMGVPILEQDEQGETRARGVLLADRCADVAFGEDDERLLFAAAQELLHSIDTERMLSATEKMGGLLAASEQLIRSVSLAEVADALLEQVQSMFPLADFTAIALRDGSSTWLAGVRAGKAFDAWQRAHAQQEIEPESLVNQCIQSCAVLPATDFERRSRSQRQVFGDGLRLTGLRALKCFPLKVAGTEGRKSQPGEERAIGALVVAGRDPRLFPDAADELGAMIELLEILTNIGAIAIQNAQRFEQLERLATTDGLTGLHNHRRFKEMLDEEVAASLRYDRSLSMILTDIDHFKAVNDTYGHPMGDDVLRRVARVLGELAREADRVCRYGGEEFSVILPETDAEGARQLAERFREQIKAQSFTCGGKQFGITLSLGICTLPDHARHRQELIDRSDQALYQAKHGGRDRTVHYADIAAAAPPGA